MKFLGLICLALVLAFSTARHRPKEPVLRPEQGFDEPPEEFQCHDLYPYNATVKGEVYSPFYTQREKYYDGLWCEYKISAPEGYRIKLTPKAIDIAPSSGCTQDKLIVYDKNMQDLLAMFCGTELPHPVLSKEGESEVRLLFQTDFMVGGKGFLIEYESSPYLTLCNPGLKECRNRNCYDPSKKCDGVDDCGDGTDEEECGFPVVTEPEQCGQTAIRPSTIFNSPDRLVGGESAIPHSWPWQVSLQNTFAEPNGHFCGGTLINAQWVVAAGHCVARKFVPTNVKIHVGAHHKFTTSKYEQIRKAVKIISYPNLEFENLERFRFSHDVTLIKLNAPVKFNDGVQPACFPRAGSKVKPGTTCYATGWGETRGSGGSDVLKQMEQIVQSNKTCGFDKDTQICVTKPYNSACHGDSGGPLNCWEEGKWLVYGAASFVTTTDLMTGLCVGHASETVYANIADKIDWIREMINKYS